MRATAPVTVLMSVRNGEHFIEECLTNILSQTYSDFHFLIVDNASTDRTRDVVRASVDPRIELVELERDLGQSGALRHGLSLCRSGYVARTDVDDLSRSTRLERQVAYLDEHTKVALLGTWYEVIDLSGCVVSVHKPAAEHPGIAKAMLFRNQFAHSSVMFRRQAAVACGSYNSRYRHAMDYALWWELILRYEAANLPELLLQIRAHPGQVTRGFSEELAREPYQIVSKVLRDSRLPVEAHRLRRRAYGYAEMRLAALTASVAERSTVRRHLCAGIVQCPSLMFTRDGSYFLAKAILNERLYGFCRGLKRCLWGS